MKYVCIRDYGVGETKVSLFCSERNSSGAKCCNAVEVV